MTTTTDLPDTMVSRALNHSDHGANAVVDDSLALTGQGLVEYALILLLIAIAAFAAVSSVGGLLGPYYQRVVDAFPSWL